MVSIQKLLEICIYFFNKNRAINMDQDRLRYDVWTNFALQQEDEAYLGIPNLLGRPNNPHKRTKAFFSKQYAQEKEAIRTGRFKNEQQRQWNEAINNDTYWTNL